MGCGPDPNAQLPGAVSLAKTGGTTGNGGTTTSTFGAGGAGGTADSSGGTLGSGGTTPSQGGTSVINPFVGGTTGSTGGIVSSGGTVGSGGVVGTGGVASVDGGGSTAACAGATPISGSVAFNTTSAFCFVTCDSTTYGWGCDSFTDKDRTVTVNGKPVTCGGTLPAPNTGGYYYFEIGAGGQTWDAIHLNGPKAASCPAPAGGFAPTP